MMVSLAGLLGRGAVAAAVAAAGGADPSPSPPEQAVAARARAASRTAARDRRVRGTASHHWWFLYSMSCSNWPARWVLPVVGVDRERDAARFEADVGGEVPWAEADERQRLGRAGLRGHPGAGLVGGLLVPGGAEEGEVDGVGARLARVDVALQGAAGGQGDGVEGRLAGRLGHLDRLGGGAGLQLHGHRDRRARPLDQADHRPGPGDRELAALATPRPVAGAGQVEGGGADLGPALGA